MLAVKDKQGSNGVSVGLGAFIDTDVTEIRDNLKDGDFTSYTDSTKLLRKVDESGIILMISATF